MKKALIILAAIATAALAAAPASAGGKRLHFGGPLGSFHATPNGGHQASHAQRKRSHAAKKTAQRRAAQKAAARRAAAKKAAARKAAVRKAQAKVQVAKVETATETKSNWKAPVRASAIAGTNTLNFRSNNETVEVDVEETKLEKKETATLQPQTTEVAELECKRYIASAGMTVTVPCGQ